MNSDDPDMKDVKLKLEDNIFSQVVSSSIIMRQVKEMEWQKKNLSVMIRPQMHVMVVSPFGTFKSALMDRIRSTIGSHNCLELTDYTKPALVGTIDDTGQFMKGAILGAAGKILLVDEFSELPGQARSILLPLLETQKIDRALGYHSKKKSELKERFAEVSVDGGQIHGKVQFTCIAGTMYFPQRCTAKGLALLSRFTPLFLSPDIGEVLDVIGDDLVKLHFSSESCSPDRVVVTQNAYYDLFEQYNNQVEEFKNNIDINVVGFVSRIWGDVVRTRVASFLDTYKGDKSGVVHVDKVKPLLKHEFQILYRFFNATQISYAELSVLSYLMKNEYNVRLVANETGYSRRFIHKVVERLRTKGFNITEEGLEVIE